jgi:GTP:adenosylcobinamide-phosphate guanylyltransferase
MPGPIFSNAVITAGGRVKDAYAAAAGTRVKALARVRGESMLDRAIAALRGAGIVRIAVVGGDEVRAACADRVDRVIDEGPTGAENVRRALAAWPDDGEPLVYATSDLPYVTAPAVADFIARAPHASVSIALSEAQAFDSRFPRAPAAFGITLAGERVVNGGIFLLPGHGIARVAALATRFFDARKQPWKMATLVSPLAVVRLCLGRLSVAHLEAEGERMSGLPACAVRDCMPELAYDADDLDEYRYACANA